MSAVERASGTMGTVLDDHEPALVPELLVTDLDRSLEFWCGLCGFSVRYARPDERFAYIALGAAHLMLEQVGVGRNWITAPLQPPLGRGINLQITVPDSSTLDGRLRAGGHEPFMPIETTWYRVETRTRACSKCSSPTPTDT
ncbi:hypothetical protein V6N00_09965 [Tersicoccus sp. MR15.9]|uniref:hypothetical protein n=1 Tax=Tersicoccus mangrovi TaxID=3121635 RepID=UPI002FE5C888